ELPGKIELVNICTPPSPGMKICDKVRQALDRAVGKINGRYSSLHLTPIRYIFRSLPLADGLTHYPLDHAARNTRPRDGLTVVAKEYVAVQGLKENPDGVLVLSEFAGASVELPYAVLTNPYDAQNMKESLLQAIRMKEDDRVLRMKRLHEIVSYYDIERWGSEFIEELVEASADS